MNHCKRPSRPRGGNRRGMGIWEVAAAVAVLAALLGVSVQFFRAAALERRAAAQRLAAIQETQNIMERLTWRPWKELSAKGLAGETLSPEARQMLVAAALKIDVQDVPETTDKAGRVPAAKRITIRLDWQNVDGQPARGVRLVAWRYPDHA
jgi:hypothetical protein